jgi:hypothetical protein
VLFEQIAEQNGGQIDLNQRSGRKLGLHSANMFAPLVEAFLTRLRDGWQAG